MVKTAFSIRHAKPGDAEEIAITVIHQAGTWASDPLTLLMLPSMASTSAAS